MSFEITLHEAGNYYMPSIQGARLPEMLGNFNFCNEGYVNSFITYEKEGETYTYQPSNTLIVTSNNDNGSFFYLQSLVAVEKIFGASPKLYLKGTFMGKAIKSKAVVWDGKEIDCFLPALPRTKEDYIAIDQNCYTCDKIEVSKKGIVLHLNAYNFPVDTWRERYIDFIDPNSPEGRR